MANPNCSLDRGSRTSPILWQQAIAALERGAMGGVERTERPVDP